MLEGLKDLWLVGDNYMAGTYRKFFLLVGDMSTKDNYEVRSFCNSRFESNMKNILARICNTFVSAVHKSEVAGLHCCAAG